MRDLLILAVIYSSLPVIVFRPFIGLLVYGWLSFMRPQDMAWATRGMPLSQWVAIAMLAGLVLTLGRERWLTIKAQTVLLMMLAGWISLSVAQAVKPDVAEEMYGYYWKTILIALLTTGLVTSRHRFRILVLLIVGCIGFLGAKRGLFGLLRGGVRFHDGPGGFMADNNTFALVLNMILPLLVAVVLTDKEKWIKVAAGITAVLCTITILFTFSRGGLLTLCVVVPAIIWRSRHRLVVTGLIGLGLAGFLFFTSENFTQAYVERASTTLDYQEDRSAQGRLDAWKTSWRVFLDYPVFGVGPNNLQVVHRTYSPDPERFRVSHNVVLQILAECGLPAVLLFLACLATAFFSLNRLRKRTELEWVEIYARMMQISIVAYIIGSMFLNTAYFELIYQLVALSVSLEVAARAAAMEPQPAPAPEPELPWWKRPAPTATWARRA